MTEKQLDILKKYLIKQNLDKLKRKDNRQISSLIDVIIKTSNIDMFTSKKAKDVLISHEIIAIERGVNVNIEKYSKIKDEEATITDVFFLLGERYYRLEQYWFKGESNSRSYNWFFIDEDLQPFNKTVYDIMVEKDIYTMQGLFDLILNRED